MPLSKKVLLEEGDENDADGIFLHVDFYSLGWYISSCLDLVPPLYRS